MQKLDSFSLNFIVNQAKHWKYLPYYGSFNTKV